MIKIKCPICGNIVELDREDFNYNEDEQNETECYECDNVFNVTCRIEYKFRSSEIKDKIYNTARESGLEEEK